MPSSVFDSTQLLALQQAYFDVCSDLGVDNSEQHLHLRNRIAVLVVKLASTGERDFEAIRRRAVMQMRNDAAA